MRSARQGIFTVVAELEAIKRQARALGVFTNDRELVECPQCSLAEDVTGGGMLITARANAEGQDTGLRFKELPRNRFRCPACKATFRGNPLDEPSAELKQTRKPLKARKR